MQQSASAETEAKRDVLDVTTQKKDEVARTARVRVKNRRKLYLDRNPSYFESPELELADPLLYDRCVRRFQSAAEREADGRAKGYSGVLEADLWRSEAKLAALDGYPAVGGKGDPNNYLDRRAQTSARYVRGPDGQVLPEDPDEISETKEEGRKRWEYEMTLRFLKGEDNEFKYEDVDESEDWDMIEVREAEDQWFEDEQPGWIGEDQDDKSRPGETGIQDF